jgi:uncharacterized protein (DUF58 family)
VGLGGIFLSALLWARSLGQGLSLQRDIRFGWAQVGDRIEERFSLRQAGWFPAPWVEVLDHSPMPDYFPSCVATVWGRSESHWLMRQQCRHRGVFQLGPTTIVSGDPFGIFLMEREYRAQTTFVVLPATIPLAAIQVASGGKVGEGRMRANALERTVGAAGVRDYVPGDSLRWIHWKTSAKKNSLFIRLFDGTPAGDWWIVLDASLAAVAGSGADSTLEHAIILAASLAQRGMREGHAVGLLAYDHQQLHYHTPQHGRLHFLSLLRELAMMKAGARPLEEVLNQLRPRECARSSILVITSDVGGDWPTAVLRMARLGGRPTVLLLDPSTYENGRDSGSLSAALVNFRIPVFSISQGMMQQQYKPIPESARGDVKIKPLGGAVPLQEKRDDAWRPLT